MSYLLMSEVNWNLPKTTLDNIGKILLKSMDFLEFLNTFTEDLKIEDLCKSVKITKTLRQDIFYGLVVYDPVRFAGLNNLRCKSADFKWN